MMAKKKWKNARMREPSNAAAEVACAPRVDWESVEADFFARESELYQIAPVENFDDLDKD